MVNNQNISHRIEQFVDHQPEISMRELLTKIYIRPLLFWICVIFPTVLALFFTALIPTTWKAEVKILLRYGSTESAFLQDLIPENRETLSGASSAEILKSIPTLINTIRAQEITDEDIYKKPHEVLGGYVGRYLEEYFPSSLPPGIPGVDPRTLLLAKSLKDSLESSSAGSKKKAIEVLEKSSQLPSSMKGDELITVQVKSFNREKVAQMANGLASAFIDEYYRVAAEDTHRTSVFLSELVTQAERDVAMAENSKGISDASAVINTISVGKDDPDHISPLLDSISRELISLQGLLAKAEGLYAPDSEQVARLRDQVNQARYSLVKQESIDKAKQALEQLKIRRYQALNTEKLYKDRLVPISIIEPAFTPKKSFSKVAIRYVISGVVGLVLGLMLGLGLVVVLYTIDPRLHTSWQVKKSLGLRILATLPDLGKQSSSDPLIAAGNSSLGMVNGLLQILGKVKARSNEKPQGGEVLVLSSASQGEGKTFLTLAIAGTIGQSKRHKVLLIDANMQDAGLSKLFNLSNNSGYIESMIDGQGVEERLIKNVYRGCDFLPAGNIAEIASLGLYSEKLACNIDKLKKLYDFIIIDTAPVLSSNEALICGLLASRNLVVVSAGTTRRALVHAAVQRMSDVGIFTEGVVFNRKKELLPAIIYRNV